VQLANNMIAVLSQALCPRVDTDGMVAAYEFLYITPSVQNLIRENKVFRIDSEIQTGKRYGMQLLDDALWTLFQAGKISAEEAIDKSKVPGQMVDRFTRAGLDAAGHKPGDFGEDAEGGEGGSGAGVPRPPGSPPGQPPVAQPANEAERQAQVAANRARMAAMKK